MVAVPCRPAAGGRLSCSVPDFGERPLAVRVELFLGGAPIAGALGRPAPAPALAAMLPYLGATAAAGDASGAPL